MFIVFAERAGSILLDNLSLTYQGIVLAIKTHLTQLHFCGPSGQGHDESQRSLLSLSTMVIWNFEFPNEGYRYNQNKVFRGENCDKDFFCICAVGRRRISKQFEYESPILAFAETSIECRIIKHNPSLSV